ncbi:Peptidoglycan O-acetyltransferase [Pigmentiphaga humi]|uniref:Probable alginate O-acetylase AlgI n=1 Tax=Pigmentiphaga humi TaxID=2478468 RepID=A0A3P4B681_9BURK|nr:MBOAT family O-acyltransferase [Pigmentiphaga humi]VCU70685.1 Peptidoglycan O-acetyltransferase [Pigmentiphaga humi]
MVFASLEFLTLFLPAFLFLYALTPKAHRNAVLMFSSWVFYGWWSPLLLMLFIALILVGWIGGMAIDATRTPRQRMGMLAAFIGINLAVLCWYKYANILVETLNQVLAWRGAMPIGWEKIVLPIGLSFIVLQSISYLIDVQRRVVPADRSLINFGAYQAMFVHLIAGPIIRYDWVARELRERTVDWPQFTQGARRFMIGFSMKVLVADTLSPLVQTAFSLPSPSLADAWLGCLAYSLQLFFDFAGYSAMAIGLGLMLGFHFPENFNHPYLARSIQDFWRRWHLSLSSWLRDYLYIPLGGNRKGAVRTYINLLLTMAIAGLWHGGDNWNYLLWGIAHGLALAITRLWNDAALPDPPELLSRVLTLLFVMLAWTLFRSHTFDSALAMYAGQFGLNGYALGDALRVELRLAHFLALALGLACIVYPLLDARLARGGRPGWLLVWDGSWPVAGFLLGFALIASRGAVPFLYFQF